MGTTFTIALRYLTARREGGGLSVVPLLSGLGIMVGVATLVVVMAVFEGYRQQILERLLSRTGHLVATKPGFRTFEAGEALVALDGTPGVASAQPVLIMQGLLLSGNRGAGVALQGMTRPAMAADSSLRDVLAAYGTPAESTGTNDALLGAQTGSGSAATHETTTAATDASPSAIDFDALSALFDSGDGIVSNEDSDQQSPIFLGRGLAATLGVAKGDALRLVLSANDEDRAAGTTAARSIGLTVAGTFSAGLYEVDQAGAVAFIEDVQSWQQTPGEASEIRVMLDDLGQRQAASRALLQTLPFGFLVSDRATDLFRDYEWVRAQGNAATLIVVVILIVAAFGIASGQLMMVQERATDIAILRGFGVQSGGVLWIFLVAGLLVALIGLVLGLALGWWVSVSLNDIRLLIEAVLDRPLLNAEFYQIDSLNGVVQPGGLMFVSLVTLVVSLIATAYPAWRASRVPPALALKEV